jgi:hypothetical protein
MRAELKWLLQNSCLLRLAPPEYKHQQNTQSLDFFLGNKNLI